MIIGIPKEIKEEEYRVSLTPDNVLELTRDGHIVYVEKNAGIGSGFEDEKYIQAGANVIDNASIVYKKAQMIVKVKEPQKSEYELLQDSQILFTYLHLAPLRELTEVLMKKNVIAIAYETIEKDGKLPLLKPMSEIAGEMAPLMGAFYLSRHQGAKGLLISGASSVKAARVLIIGNGTVAKASLKIACGLGADVHMLVRNPNEKNQSLLNTANLENELKIADIIICAVLIKGAKAPYLITKEMLRLIQKGSIIVDVSIDQGGCTETSHPTTHNNPIYEVDGIWHYCVANMPGAYPKTASLALSNESIEYVKLLAQKGWKNAIKESKPLRLGLNVCLGKVTYEAVALSHALEYTPVENIENIL